MDIKEIQELLKFVKENGFDEFSMEDGDFKLSLKSNAVVESNQQTTILPIQQAMPMAQTVAPAAYAPPPAAVTPEEPAKTAEEPTATLLEIKSPIVGTFYRSPNPEKGPYVQIGDSVSNGTVVCIVEAMKLFNEIESEVSGKIVKVMVEDAQPIEYDQVLFLVDPNA